MIDFLEPGAADKVFTWFNRLIRTTTRSTHLTVAVAALLLVAFSLEGFRVRAAWQLTARSQTQLDVLSRQLIESERREHARVADRATFLSLAELRARSALQAARIAMLGNAISPRVALISLRRNMDGIEIEGRAREIEDVALSMRRLQVSESAHKSSFALKRDESGSGFIWFRLGLQR